ncbi:cytochrome b N-terminal domain-containing protein [Leeuwenhoekiella sp. A16]|uniref:cytochrome b N-terminal domain-containing protein n=1 Tax=unclassified Leeuwenhoekiella TaxID=2615029 RepID=UPI003A7F7106
MKILRRIGKWLNDRGKFADIVKPLKTHLVPPGTKWNYIWGSGVLFCFTVQVITGIALSFMYQPSVNAAYESLQHIENEAFLGSFIRGLHNWGASGMVVLLGVHMARVYLNAAYKYPREMSWISGVFLLGITVTMAFTGQLLRWDGNGVWTAILGAEQMGRIPVIGDYVAYFFLGGKTMGGQTLNRFFSMHVFLLPGLLSGIIGYHIFLVFKNGISEPPKPGRLVNPATYRKWYDKLLKKKGLPFFPDVIWRDVVFTLVVLLILIALAFLVGAPKLTKPPDPTILEVEPKPDWYFKWLYAIFATMNRKLEPYFLFFGPLIGGIILFSIPFLSKGGERHPIKRPWAIAGIIFVIVTLGSLTYIGMIAPWVPKFDAEPVSAYIALPAENENQVKKGVELFNTMGCIYCHKIGKKGGLRGPDLTKVEKRLTKDQMIIRITNGAENMPAYGGSLSSEELDDLISFLAAEKQQK